MIPASCLYLFALLAVLSSTRAAIGPVADLVISNQNIAPDGFTRKFVTSSHFFRFAR